MPDRVAGCSDTQAAGRGPVPRDSVRGGDHPQALQTGSFGVYCCWMSSMWSSWVLVKWGSVQAVICLFVVDCCQLWEKWKAVFDNLPALPPNFCLCSGGGGPAAGLAGSRSGCFRKKGGGDAADGCNGVGSDSRLYLLAGQLGGWQLEVGRRGCRAVLSARARSSRPAFRRVAGCCRAC